MKPMAEHGALRCGFIGLGAMGAPGQFTTKVEAVRTSHKIADRFANKMMATKNPGKRTRGPANNN